MHNTSMMVSNHGQTNNNQARRAAGARPRGAPQMADDPKNPKNPEDEPTISASGAPTSDDDETLAAQGDNQPRDPVSHEPVAVAGYKILGKLGQGGMGVVWEAEQEHPKRRVALKVLRRDHLVDDYHARMFRREVETLARLKHPNIAAIYETGTTDDGHDYFAMELVRGETLGRWLEARADRVDANELELRLELFRAMCDAVHYAHQRGVIHRDIKPANIIVTEDATSLAGTISGTSRPTIKILDFGLARLTDADIAATMVSEIGTIKGTLQYMSPEQARGDMESIDTRTDVYALGVILYQMLTGRLPYEVTRGAVVEAIRIICEDPPTPLRDSWSGVRRLDADLETIVGKALEKDAERRYVSAAALAEDIERHLESQPILARPPSALYQIRKFASRNRTLVSAAVGALLMLLVFAVTMTIQAERIRREAERANREAATAREVSEFLIGLFDRSDPTLAQGEDLTARQLLDSGADRIEALDNQPQTQAAFMETMGRVFTNLGEFERADPLLDRAVDIRRLAADGDELALAQALHFQAILIDQQGHYEDAEEPIRRAVEIRERRLGDHPDLGHSLNTLGNVLWHQGRLDEAEVVHRGALDLRQRILPPDHTDIGQSMHNLGALRYFAGDLAEAERLWRRSAEIEEAAHGPDDWNLATSLHTLAIVCSDQQRFGEALELELRSLAIREKVLGPNHPHVALSLTTLGNIYRETDREAEAEPLIRRAISIMEAAVGPTNGEVLWMRRSLARTLISLERYADADTELAGQIEIIESTPVTSELPSALSTLGELRVKQGRFEEAESTYLRAIEVLETDSPDDPFLGLIAADLARLYRDTGRREEAETNFRRAVELMEEGWGPSDPDLQKAAAELEELVASATPEEDS
jgi:serine/threonine protein kinase/Flp pilus assembly protein TadD